MITARELRVAVPAGTTSEQWAQINRAVEYGQSKGVTVIMSMVMKMNNLNHKSWAAVEFNNDFIFIETYSDFLNCLPDPKVKDLFCYTPPQI